MNPRQYRAALATLDISQVKAAHLLGVDPRTSRAWALDQSKIPPAVAILLRLMVAKKITPEDVENVK